METSLNTKTKNNIKYILLVMILIIMLLISIVVAVTFGPVPIKVKEVFDVLIYNFFNIQLTDIQTLTSGTSFDIIWEIRMPRVLLGMVVGMSLSTVGVIMQAMVQNLLADPYILGISSGASLGAACAIFLGIGSAVSKINSISFCAFIGALITSIAVYVISNIGEKSSSGKLILSGMIISSLCSAFTSFLIFIQQNSQAIRNLTFWTMGSMVSASWDNIIVPLIVTILGIIFFTFNFRPLNLMLTGNDTSITLGVNLNSYRKIYMIITSLMTGVVVATAGTVGFIGLIIPHVIRMIVGSDHKILIPVASLIGGIFLIWMDVLARTLLNGNEIPIGVLTSLIGAPFFLYLMIKKSYGFGGN